MLEARQHAPVNLAQLPVRHNDVSRAGFLQSPADLSHLISRIIAQALRGYCTG